MLAALVATLFLSACQPKEQKIYIVSTNDMHANIDNFPQMAALLDSLRAVHPDLLLFGAGDNRSGNPINDRYAEPAKPMYELMNAVFLTTAVIIFEGINKFKIIRIGEIRRELNLAVFAMSIAGI